MSCFCNSCSPGSLVFCLSNMHAIVVSNWMNYANLDGVEVVEM